MRNPRDVWTISPASYSKAHFAVMPMELAVRCIRAGTTEKGACSLCDAALHPLDHRQQRVGWEIRCGCEWEIEPGFRPPIGRPSVVLDPFAGSGTTLIAAATMGRDFLGIERSPPFCELAQERFVEQGMTEPPIVEVPAKTSLAAAC